MIKKTLICSFHTSTVYNQTAFIITQNFSHLNIQRRSKLFVIQPVTFDMSCADLFRSKNRSFEYGTFSYESSDDNEHGELKTIIFTVLIATLMVFGTLTNGFVIYVLGKFHDLR